MVGGSGKTRGRCAVAAAALLLCLAGQAGAAGGFIAGTFVDKTDGGARISVQFRCAMRYLGHDADPGGDRVRIRLDSTGICLGVAPGLADTREQLRPAGADRADLVSIEYDGESPSGRTLLLDFAGEVTTRSVRAMNDYTILVDIGRGDSAAPAAAESAKGEPSRLVRHDQPATTPYVINLASWNRPPTSADLPTLELDKGLEVFVRQATIDGKTWYRIRLGYFDSSRDASLYLRRLRADYPQAWIDRAGNDAVLPEPAAGAAAGPDTTPAPTAGADTGELMAEARLAMISGEIGKAIQYYTKVLQQPAGPDHPDAQEYLALARERNGQLAHARAEYTRYLDLYPDGDGADRVQQRLAALLSTSGSPAAGNKPAAGGATAAPKTATAWNLRTFASQYYRRDANQVNDEDQLVSQSSIYTDVSVDARRRGERFDFSARLAAGHRSDLLATADADGRDLRVSYAYADLADSQTGLRGRLGRQTRNSGGVLGRFDGIDLGYSFAERWDVSGVLGKPVFSTADGIDDNRTFAGLSLGYGPLGDNTDARVYLLQQNIDGLTDRRAIGTELRHFGEHRTLWAMLDYDTAFAEIGSAFLQGSMRLPGKLTLSGAYDQRKSPWLSLGNAIIGQPVEDFSDLATIYGEAELRQLALDRSPPTTTLTLGLSRPLSPKLQLNLNATRSTVEGTPESGGVLATPASEYSYFSADLVASSLLAGSDVTILSLRYSESTTSEVYTVNIDSRLRVGRTWRFSPRLRVDRRRIPTDGSEQWTYSPGLRLDYRPGRRLRLELQAGRQFSLRDALDPAQNQDRKSYFVNVGYQVFF